MDENVATVLLLFLQIGEFLNLECRIVTLTADVTLTHIA
jgi:hypothetical protein